MGAPAKYLFEVDFAAGNRAPNTVALAEHKTQLAEAETRGYANGFAAAHAEAQAEVTRKLSLALERISQELTQITAGLSAVESRLEAEAVEVASAVARKLAPELIQREPLAEIASLVADCLRHLSTAPHVVIRVSEGIYPQARERLERIAQDLGFAGRLVVMAEADMGNDDCRVEWADGGLIRDRAATEQTIAETIGRYLNARGKTPLF
jgi:flagellar assembly protein FliH